MAISQDKLARVILIVAVVVVVVVVYLGMKSSPPSQTAYVPSRPSESESIDSELTQDQDELMTLDKLPDIRFAGADERSYNEKLLAQIRWQKKSETAPNHLALPVPDTQEAFCKLFHKAGIILGIETLPLNELQQIEIDKIIERMRPSFSRRLEFQRWLVTVRRIEIVREGVIKLTGGMRLFIHGCEFHCDDPHVIATLGNLDLPAVVEIDGAYTGRFEDLGAVIADPVVMTVGDTDFQVNRGNSLFLKFDVTAVRTLYDDAGEAMLMKRIKQEKAGFSSN